MSSVRVGILQAEPGSGITEEEIRFFREENIRVLGLPEYFWIDPADAHHRDALAHFDASRLRLDALSRENDWCVVGGTMVEPGRDGGWHNTCFVVDRGEALGRYRKINLMPGERERGAVSGETFLTVEVDGLRLAPVICADVLDEATFGHVAELEADLIVAPVASPYLPRDTPEAKDARDRTIFARGSRSAGAPIIKICGTGRLFGRRLQGRSLAVSGERILFRTPFEDEHRRLARVVEVKIGV